MFSASGYQQYVSQRLVEANKDVKNFYGGILRNVRPQLAHKQGAFIDFGSYRAQTEPF